jgi:hypothetical protein
MQVTMCTSIPADPLRTRDQIVVLGSAGHQERRVAPSTNWVAFSLWAKGEQRGGDVVVAEPVVAPPALTTQPRLGGKGGSVVDAVDVARSGDVDSQQIPSRVGRDPCRPAD